MSWTLIPIALTFAALLVGHIKDWRDHDRRKRWFAIALGMIGLASAVASAVGVLKGNRDAGKMSAEMAALREQLEIANKPKPQAELQVGLIDPTPGTPMAGVQSLIYAPVEGGHVTICLTMFNKSQVTAVNGMLSVRLCDGCTYAKEPRGFDKPFGGLETDRNFRFARIEGTTTWERLMIEVVPPVGPDKAGFMVGTKVFCDNCGLPPKDLDYLTVRFAPQTASAAP